MRTAEIIRNTSETQIKLTLNLDGTGGRAAAGTGTGSRRHRANGSGIFSRCDSWQSLQDKGTVFFGVELLKIELLQGDPAGKELLRFLRRAAALDAAALLCGGNAEKNRGGIVGRQLRMHAVSALYDLKGDVGDADGGPERHGRAVETAEDHVFPPRQGQKHLLQQTLPIHVAAGLGKPLGRTLVGLQKVVVGAVMGTALCKYHISDSFSINNGLWLNPRNSNQLHV